MPAAEAADFDTEWLDSILSVAVVDGVDAALAHIASDSLVSDALFAVLEVQNMLQSTKLNITFIPREASMLAQLEAARHLRPLR